jgi:LacI family transcriptional regulator
VADSLGYRRLTLHRTLVAESAPEKLAKSLIRSSKKRHAMIVFGNEHPLVYEALRQCREANVPVITLVTDLPGAGSATSGSISSRLAAPRAG